MPETPLHYLTITELADRIRSGDLSPVDATQAQLDRIDNLDGHLKSYATVMTDHAIGSARRAEEEIADGNYRGPLHGVPIAVKDLCFTMGVRTMGGSKVNADLVPSFDSTVVAKLEAAGAVLLGKLNLTEGAMGGYNPALQIPLNPWNMEQRPLDRIVVERLRRGDSSRTVLRLSRQRHRRLDPLPGRSVRHSRHQADVGQGEPLRSAGTRRVAGSRRSHDSQRRRLRSNAPGHRWI